MTEELGIINTDQMTIIIKETLKIFKASSRTECLWINGRISNFGFRPSFKKDYLPSILKGWIQDLREGKIVITPIVFYPSAKEDPEKFMKVKDRENFHAYHHYNILFSWINDQGVIEIERYEPGDSTKQSNLDSEMKKLLLQTFREETKESINYTLIAPKGLQAKFGDSKLCGHHILFWMLYRLKKGRKKALDLLSSEKDAGAAFQKFCDSMGHFTKNYLD
jgi:acylphosphatase